MRLPSRPAPWGQAGRQAPSARGAEPGGPSLRGAAGPGKATSGVGVCEWSRGAAPRTRARSPPGGQEPGAPGGAVTPCLPCRAAVQRVVAAMNQMDQKKHEKFANQFNYALS